MQQKKEDMMRSATVLLLWSAALSQAHAFSALTCANRPIHATFDGRGYMFSWLQAQTARLELNWYEAREFCRARCMDLVSLETREENDFVKGMMNSVPGEAEIVWTSGRKCTFAGCDRVDLMPADIYGWLWAGSLTRIPPTTNRLDSDWSDLGSLGVPQPDNFEKQQGGPEEEECLAFVRYSMEEGFKWHDVACHHRGPFVCEDDGKLLQQYGIDGPSLVSPVQLSTPQTSEVTTTTTTTSTERTRQKWGEQEQPAPQQNLPYRDVVNDKF